MVYTIKETFRTFQGEGGNIGRLSVFLRFSGCNAWSGRAEDRASGRGACAAWCDTDFVGTDGPGGGRFSFAADLAAHVDEVWSHGPEAPPANAPRWVVCTGGEPLLQLDGALLWELAVRGFRVAVETNGSVSLPVGERIDWVCVSPKAGLPLKITRADEIKIVVPHVGLDLAAFDAFDAPLRWLMPQDGPELRANIQHAAALCARDPRWRLGIQAHKFLGFR